MASAADISPCHLLADYPFDPKVAAFCRQYNVPYLYRRVTSSERIPDIDNRLQELGLCSACAGNAARIYVEQPASLCGKLIKHSLEGDPAALETLTTYYEYKLAEGKCEKNQGQ